MPATYYYTQKRKKSKRTCLFFTAQDVRDQAERRRSESRAAGQEKKMH